MPRKMKSLRLDEELCAWSEEYAKERGVSWAQVVEAAIRELQASAMGGVPDLGQPSKVRAVTPLGPVREQPAAWAALQRERQARLNRAKGL